MNIGVYDVATMQIVRCWNDVAAVEKKGEEIHFLHEGIPKFFLARRGNYIIVPNVSLEPGLVVSDELLAKDQKASLFVDQVAELQRQIKQLQQQLNELQHQ